ncbi:MAG: hypothetical protein AVDCRST_MAG47-3201, partial [uncultured Nocardioidaceae bacterium]
DRASRLPPEGSRGARRTGSTIGADRRAHRAAVLRALRESAHRTADDEAPARQRRQRSRRPAARRGAQPDGVHADAPVPAAGHGGGEARAARRPARWHRGPALRDPDGAGRLDAGRGARPPGRPRPPGHARRL